VTRYAEVIGDPIAHSLSPAIHNHWFGKLGLAAEFRATRVSKAELASYLETRRVDPDWLGCSITAPLKQAITGHLDEAADTEGAVNCVYRCGGGLKGMNTDVDGIEAALGAAPVAGGKVVVIGAGGAARAMLGWLGDRPHRIVLLVRNPERMAAPCGVDILSLDQAADALAGAILIVNATPMGMAGAPAMPPHLLDELAAAPGAWVMDMVYRPLDTPLLNAARARGLTAVDGLAMLIGQARAAFRIFADADPPEDDAELRALLSGSG
jgi:shikimate dehydrogenase